MDLEDSRESIRLLEEGIHFAQKNLEACERRVSAQKGQRNKANSRFATTIEALNLEASYILGTKSWLPKNEIDEGSESLRERQISSIRRKSYCRE